MRSAGTDVVTKMGCCGNNKSADEGIEMAGDSGGKMAVVCHIVFLIK